MGAANALRVYAAWGGVLDDRPLRVLIYMALVARDRDAEPWYSQGHEAISEMALATPVPAKPPEREQVLRAVRRAITKLHKAGAIRTVKRATYGKRGTTHVHYRLYLDGPPQVAQRPMGNRVDNYRPQVAERPMNGQVIGHSATYDPPVHRSLSDRP